VASEGHPCGREAAAWEHAHPGWSVEFGFEGRSYRAWQRVNGVLCGPPVDARSLDELAAIVDALEAAR
jgi:hypothetical protein